MSEKNIDQFSGIETTGHEWDGIRELNNPLPRWWLWTFYASIVWSIGYVIMYPAIPLVTDATKGVLGYSSRAEVAREIVEARAAQAATLERIAAMPLEDIRKDDSLLRFAVAGGRAAFRVNCIQCHGTGAAGGRGYPNLNDDEWLWGGSLEAIRLSIAHGIRFDGDDGTRFSEMPAFGRDGLLTGEQIRDVAEYVLSLSGSDHDSPAAARGVEPYAENCAVCHGENGGGDREQGAPALNNAIWLYGGDRDSIVETITYSRRGVMPAWGHRLDETTIRKLTLYVHSLGGGEKAE